MTIKFQVIVHYKKKSYGIITYIFAGFVQNIISVSTLSALLLHMLFNEEFLVEVMH